MKNSIKTLATWLIIGVICVILISSILDSSNNKLAYSELVAKIESGDVKEIEIASDGSKADVKLKDENLKLKRKMLQLLELVKRNGQQ